MPHLLSNLLSHQPDPASERAEARDPAVVWKTVGACFRAKALLNSRISVKKKRFLVPAESIVQQELLVSAAFFCLPSFCALPGGDSALRTVQKMVRVFFCAQIKR